MINAKMFEIPVLKKTRPSMLLSSVVENCEIDVLVVHCPVGGEEACFPQYAKNFVVSQLHVFDWLYLWYEALILT